MTLAQLLQTPTPLAHHNTPLNALDLTFAQWLHTHQPAPHDAAFWLAALTSHQWGRGHACLDLHALDAHAAPLLGWTPAQAQALPPHLGRAAAEVPWTQGDHSPLVHDAEGGRMYLRRAWQAEQFIRSNLQQRLAQAQPLPRDAWQRLDSIFGTPHPSQALQRRACEVALQHPVALITGGPGTGKTATVVRLLAALVGGQTQGMRIHLAAPTGKAAARLIESIAHAAHHLPAALQVGLPTQAQTLHRLLHSHSAQASPPLLATDLVVVDEASMVDLEMMARLLRAVPLQARLVLLGDKDQLASVEAGAVMSQLCANPLLQHHTTTLTHSHRFDAHSGIGQWAQAVNHHPDQVPALWQDTPDVLTHPRNTPWPSVTRLTLRHTSDPAWFDLVRQGWHSYQNLINAAAYNATQAREVLHALAQFAVLCALREGPWGVQQLNLLVEKALQLNPSQDPHAWYVGRPVMVTRNDYALDLMNGDIGVCLRHADGQWRVAFASSDPTSVRWVAPARLDSVETVFAMTVHKSQGSEFNHVLLALPDQHAPVLTRELVYTGLTRAKERLTLWAPQPGVLSQACAQKVLRSGGLAQ